MHRTLLPPRRSLTTRALPYASYPAQRTDSGANFDEFKNPQTGSITSRTFTGHGADTDILVASAKSYLSALNRILDHRVRQSNNKKGGGSEEQVAP